MRTAKFAEQNILDCRCNLFKNIIIALALFYRLEYLEPLRDESSTHQKLQNIE